MHMEQKEEGAITHCCTQICELQPLRCSPGKKFDYIRIVTEEGMERGPDRLSQNWSITCSQRSQKLFAAAQHKNIPATQTSLYPENCKVC